MRRLIVCEKNHAAHRIALILSDNTYKKRSVANAPVFHFTRDGDEIDVMALRGHIMELDYPKELNNWSSISPKDLVHVKPEKKVDSSAKNIMNALKALASQADEIIVATDYDREGELIGVEALEELEVKKPVRRARFSALTKSEVEKAFEQPAEIDYKLASAAETRQLIDLAWGASLTRFMSLASGQKGKDFLSVGRVQSPTLALIVDREKVIRGFVPTPYWLVSADLEKEGTFRASHKHGKFEDKDEAAAVLARARKTRDATVTSAEQKENTEYPPAPFNTTTFLAEATKQGMTAAQAMKVAEDLYTDGYISYPRTDNTVYPPSLGLKAILEKLKASEFSKEAEEILSQESIRPSRGKKTTTDHPPIHPVDAATKAELKGQKWTVYELVTRRFLATLAPPCISSTTKVDLDIGGEPFESEGYAIKSPGWRKYYPYFKVNEVALPPLAQGDAAKVLKVSSTEKKTQPPPRYSQGTLIQAMERLGLGTKSTRHDAIQKLYDRQFVKGVKIEPTESGIAMVNALEEHANMVTDAKMTSHLESDMDMIAQGSLEQDEVVEESQAMLDDIHDALERNRTSIRDGMRKALQEQHELGQCPKCKVGRLLERRSRKGGKFLGCSNYPNCTNTYPLPYGMLVVGTKEACEVCGSPRIKLVTKGQAPLTLCADPSCPAAKKERYVGKCPSCGGDLTMIHSKRGKRFAGCSGYPECKVMYPLPQRGRIEPTDELCDGCGSPVIKVFTPGRSPWVTCLNMSCPKKEGKARKPSDARRTEASSGK